MYKLYGIPNCDTVKKARKYLDENKISYEFVNFKNVTPSIDVLSSWSEQMGDDLINKKGRTYRSLSSLLEAAKREERLKIIQQNLSAIRRPIITKNGTIKLYGLDLKKYEAFFKQQ